ncbi:hypothetical protein P3L10_014274 [Capsicum annuum]
MFTYYTMKGFISIYFGFIFTIFLMAPNVSARWNIDPKILEFGRRLLPQVINDQPSLHPKVMSLSASETKGPRIPGRG